MSKRYPPTYCYGNKTINDYLFSEIKSPKNNAHRKRCLQEIQKLFKNKQRDQTLRDILLRAAVRQEITGTYDFNQMVLSIVIRDSKLPECSKYLRLLITQ